MSITPGEYLKTIWHMLPEIAEQTGYPWLYITRYFVLYYIKYRVQIDEFQTLRLYEYSPRKVDEYLLWRRCMRYSDGLNAQATKEELDVFEDKHIFNRVFGEFVNREWLYIPEAAPSDIEKFMSRHPVFLVKTCTGTQGKSIYRFASDEITPKEIIRRFGNGRFLLESLIVQHPLLQAVNPGSVNTVRLVVAKKNDKICFVGAGLRCGGSGQFVDNFHHDGAAYPIDLETGRVTGPGIDLKGNSVLCHSTTGYVMPGLQVPHWQMLLNRVREASGIVPHVGYIGWDLAITENGVEFVEGNVNYPGNNIIQIDGPGAWRRLKKFVDEMPG